MRTGQHSRRRTTQRLLLLAAATGAGIGISLAVDSAAHADDTHQPPPPDTAIAVGGGIRGTAQKAVAPKPRAQDPTTLARDLAERTTKRVDRAARRTHLVKNVRAALDQADAPQSVLGGTVDTATDLTDRIVDTAPAVFAPLTLPGLTLPAADVTIPAAGTTAAHAAPQAAPEPAGEQPPLITVGSGAPAVTVQHLAVGAPPGPVGRHHVAAAVNGHGQQPGPHHLDFCHRGHVAAAPTVEVHLGTPAGRWTDAPRWQHAITGYVYNRSGRIPPPSPPSG